MTFNSLDLIPQLERRNIFLNNLEVEVLFNESNPISQPMCMNHPNIWLDIILGFTKIQRARDFGEGWSLHIYIKQNERNQRTLIDIFY